MNFGFSEEQDLLRSEVRKLFDSEASMDKVREVIDSAEGYSHALWKQLGELGYSSLTLPEAYGGAGLGWVDLTVVLEEAGRCLAPAPLISNLLASSMLLDLGDEAQKETWLPQLGRGSRIGTVAFLEDADSLGPESVGLRGRRAGSSFVVRGEKRFVQDAGAADVFLVPFRSGTSESLEDLGIALVERNDPGVRVEPIDPVDPTKRLGSLILEDVKIAEAKQLGSVGDGFGALSRAAVRGAACVTAEMIGSIEAILDLTVEFAKQRTQFGKPIGQFQGVKHPLAEMYVDVESLKSLLYHAMWALDVKPDRGPLAVSEAKAFGSAAIASAGVVGIQLHGAVGYTYEYDIQFYLKRSKWARAMFGDEDHHYDRIALLGGY